MEACYQKATCEEEVIEAWNKRFFEPLIILPINGGNE